LWAIGIYDLRLSDEQFWQLTPAQFNALVKRKMIDEEQKDYRTALICSVIANVFRDKKKRRKPFKPQDFMPQRRKQKRKQTWQEQLALVQILNVAFGGKDRRYAKC